MKRIAAIPNVILLIALTATIFLAFYNPAILNPHNVGWLLRGTDNGENALGLHAWHNDIGRGLSLRTTLLNFPDGVAVLFTDSNPLLAIATLPIATLLGKDLQFLGLWVLICLFLQALFAHALLEQRTSSKAALWTGIAIFMLLPTFYARQYHVNLQSHWLILWALWIFIDKTRSRDGRCWAANLVTAILIHNYLFFIVGAVWGTALLRNFVMVSNGTARLYTVGQAFIIIVVLLIVINNLGIHNDFVATNTYGTFAMPLDALWRPSNPTYSMLLSWPETRQSSAFEGFQYLGVGVLTLLTAIPFVSWLTPYDDKSSSLNRQLLWLGPACIALALLAITNQITVAGEVVLTLPLSPSLIALLDPLRASGRLFWLVTYVLLLLAITTAYRLPPPRAIQLLGAVLGLQVIDMSGTMIATQETTKEAALENQWKYTADPRWPSVIASANDVTFAPTNPFVALDLFQEVAWRSISAGKPVRLVYAARNSRVTDARLAAEQADFDAGELDSRRLYILFPGTKVPGNAESRLLILDGVRMLIPIKVSAQSAPS